MALTAEPKAAKAPSLAYRPRPPSTREPPRKKRKSKHETKFNGDDPVVAEYDVYITAPITSPQSASNPASTTANPGSSTANDSTNNAQPQAKTGVFLLQYPNRPRNAPYINADSPTTLRIKTDSGFMELEVPTNLGVCYDETKARQWGKALERAEANTGKGGTGYGLANGFAGESSKGSAAHGNDSDEEGDEAHDGAGPSLQSQTLGGFIQTCGDKPGPLYMIGTFRGTQLHLTPVQGIAQLRPTHVHVDALQAQSQQDGRAASAATPQTTTQPLGPSSTAGTQGVTTDNAPDPQLQPTTRIATAPSRPAALPARGPPKESRSTRALLNRAATEHWSHLEYHDEETSKAYQTFEKEMFYESAPAQKDRGEAAAEDHGEELIAVWPGSKKTGNRRGEGWLNIGGTGTGKKGVVQRGYGRTRRRVKFNKKDGKPAAVDKGKERAISISSGVSADDSSEDNEA